MATVNKTSVRVVTRLIEMGITTEKAVTSLELKDALAIPGITVADLTAICNLQTAIKSRKLFEFFVEADKDAAMRDMYERAEAELSFKKSVNTREKKKKDEREER